MHAQRSAGSLDADVASPQDFHRNRSSFDVSCFCAVHQDEFQIKFWKLRQSLYPQYIKARCMPARWLQETSMLALIAPSLFFAYFIHHARYNSSVFVH